MVFYKHKETGAVISLKRLKEMYYGTEYKIVFGKSLSFYNEEVLRYEYRVDEIPFSEDFEVIAYKEDFTYDEVCFLERMMFNSVSFYEREDMIKSISKKFNERKREIAEERLYNERFI